MGQLANARAAIPLAPSSNAKRGDAKLSICKLVDSPAPKIVGKTSLILDDPSILIECNVDDNRTVSPKHMESSNDNCALLISRPLSLEYGFLAANNKSCSVPELCGPPSQAGVGYHVFDTTESELRLSGGQSNGCLGNVEERPIIVAGANTPRGNDEKIPGG